MAKSQVTKNWLKYLKPNFWFFGIFFVVSILDQLIFAYFYDDEMSGFFVVYGYLLFLTLLSIRNGIQSYRLLNNVVLPNLLFCAMVIISTWWMTAFLEAYGRADTLEDLLSAGRVAFRLGSPYAALSFVCSIVVKIVYLISRLIGSMIRSIRGRFY